MAPKKTTTTAQTVQPVQTVQSPEPVVKVEDVEEEHEDTENETEAEVDQDPSTQKTRARRNVTKDSLFQSLGELIAQIDGEVTKLSELKDKPKGLRFIKRVRKALHVIESDARKVLKFKNAAKKSNSVSGFMKPVFISEEMATFTGLDLASPYPRPQITSAICKYIEKHNLQNPADRREFRVDAPLQKLLRYNPAEPPKDEQGNPIPMTYFRLQKYMQHHFNSGSTTSAPVTVTEHVVTPVAEPVVVCAVPTPVPATSGKRKAK
jgi:chromatin remodeling complex protein RSC6